MPFPTTAEQVVNNDWNITALSRPARQLRYIVYQRNFMIAQ